MNDKSSFWKSRLPGLCAVAFLLLTGVIAYSGTLDQPFHFDDTGSIVNNFLIRNPWNIPRFFVEIKGQIIAQRPLEAATLALNYAVSGLETWSYHVVNIGIHIVNSILLYLLVLKCLVRSGMEEERGRVAALVAGLLFVAHPIQTESVTYLVTRSMLLAAFFYFSGFLLFLRAVGGGRRRWWHVLAMGLISFLGMASREDFVTFPLMLLLFDYVFVSVGSARKVYGNRGLHIPAWVGLIYLGFLVGSHKYRQSGFGIVEITPYEYFLTQTRVYWTYLRMLVLPVGQNIDHDYAVSTTLLEPRTMVALAGYIGLWCSGLYLLARRHWASYPVLWFMILLTPASSIVPLADVIFEHRVYMASAGVFVLMGLMVSSIRRPALVVSTVAVLAIVLAVSTYRRNAVWETRISLWEEALTKSPLKARVHYNLGTVYNENGRTDDAIRELKKALELKPEYPEANYNLGVIYQINDRVDLAIKHYRRVIKEEPKSYEAHNNLSIALRTMGEYDEAIREAKLALSLNPKYVNALNSLAMGYAMKGDAAQAIEYLQMSLRMDPDRSTTYQKFAFVYRLMGRHDLEREALLKANMLEQRGK